MKIKVGVIGLGYVGLPLVLLLTKKKINTLGFDLDEKKISKLKKNISYISDAKNSDLHSINKKQLYCMKDIQNIKYCDYIVFCLPTPLKNNAPDLSYINNAFNNCYDFLRKNQTIILESTVYPGATEEIFVKKLNKKFVIGENFFLCFSPERIDPGNQKFKNKNYKNITKLISGYTNNCTNNIKKLYSKIFKKIFICQNIKIAETAKLFENSFRSVNIGLSNEFKMLCHKLKINIFSVLDAAETKPFGFKRFDPGPGVGGHCIPIDPLFVKWIGKKNNFNTHFITLSNKTNNKVTTWTINKILDIYKKNNFKYGRKILFLGATYKKNVNDLRESVSIKIFNYFLKKKIPFDFYDPYVNKIKLKQKSIKSISNLKKIKKYCLTVLLVDHDLFDLEIIYKKSNTLIDTRGKFNTTNGKKLINL
jgi:UDP-N-acetyl-D-glucosamine dehydrogenase